VTRNLPPGRARADGTQFVRGLRKGARLGNGYPFILVDLGSGELLGQIRLFHFSWSERHAEIGYFLARRYWGQGYATEAVGAVLRFAFERLRLHRVEANVVAPNVVSAHVLQRWGFREEGRSRDAARYGGRWADERHFGLLAPEFSARARRRPGRL
jgi:[ribosomal protein S5]-alanine N-acetyltransferase